MVEVTEPTGADLFVFTTLCGVEIVSRMRSNCGACVGQQAPFSINMSKAVVFDHDTGERID